MVMASDVPRLISHPRRRAIACATLDEALTIGEIAEQLGTKDGAIRSMVQNLFHDGLLIRSERPSRRKGMSAAEYRVDPAYATAVRAGCAGASVPLLEENAEIVLLPLSGLAAAAGVVTSRRPEVIAWAVRTPDPQLSVILGLRRESPPDERDALLLALRDAGVDCARVHLGETFGPAEFLTYAGRLLPPKKAGLLQGD